MASSSIHSGCSDKVADSVDYKQWHLWLSPRGWVVQDEDTVFGARWGLVLGHPWCFLTVSSHTGLYQHYIVGLFQKITNATDKDRALRTESPSEGSTSSMNTIMLKSRFQCVFERAANIRLSQIFRLVLFYYWKQKTWTHITKDPNQRLTWLLPFIKPGAPGFTPKDRHWSI